MSLCDPKFIDEDYAQLLMNLFPPGQAFERRRDTDLWFFNLGLAQELRRIDERINKLVCESDPTEAVELIGEWEKDLGFPNDCFDIPLLLADRQKQITEHVVFPTHLKTPFVSTGDTTKDSAIITNIPDTIKAIVGDLIDAPLGFGKGKWEVIDRTSTTLTLETTANATTVGIALQGYFSVGEPSERLFTALALSLGYASLSFASLGSFLLGVTESGYSETGDTTVTSDEITNVSSVVGIQSGDFVRVSKGFGIFERKVLQVFSGPNKLKLDISAASSNVGVSIDGYRQQPFGMGNPLGDAFAYGATLTVGLGPAPADNLDLITCVFNKLKPAHIQFIYTT